MNAKRPLTMLVALALVASVFAAGPAAASAGDCNVTQSNSQTNVLNANTDTNVNAVNGAVSVPVLSFGDSYAESNQGISDGGDSFQSQSNVATC